MVQEKIVTGKGYWLYGSQNSQIFFVFTAQSLVYVIYLIRILQINEHAFD